MRQGAAAMAQRLGTLATVAERTFIQSQAPQPFLTPVPGDMTGVTVKYIHARRQNIRTHEIK